MNKHRKLEHPEILVERAGSGIFDKAFSIMEEQFKNLGKSSGHIAEVAETMGMLNFIQDDCNKAQFFSLYNWWKNEKPIYRLTEDLTMALAHTEPPMKKFELDPRACVPLSGMYIALPPVFQMGSTIDGNTYAVEGIYIVEDLVKPAADLPPEEGVLFLGVGEDQAKGAWLNRDWTEGPCRDDTLIFFTVCKDRDLGGLLHKGTYSPDGDRVLGVPELAKLAFNLLWMLQYVPHSISNRTILDVPLKGKKDRAIRREIERLGRKGRTHRGYTLLDLATGQRNDGKSSVGSRTVRSHIVRGHVHHYWVNDPKGKKPVEIKNDGGKAKYLIPKWVLPYKKG